MKTKKIAKYILITCLAAFTYSGCSDLEPEFEDVSTEQNFFVSDEAFIAAMGPAYTNLQGLMRLGGVFSLQEISSDEVCIPQRGTNDDQDQQWIRLHTHSFSASDPVFNQVWTFSYDGIHLCNRLIAQFERTNYVNAPVFIAEMRVLRAYYYLILLDVFGNVPIIDSFLAGQNNQPATAERAEVFAFVENSLKENMPRLSKSVDTKTYGRMHYYVAQALLAHLYLNAEAYTGTPRYADSVIACDAVINAGIYRLENDYFRNFEVNNQQSQENIWSIPYDQNFASGFDLQQTTLHFESQKTFNLTERPRNLYCSLPDFYRSFGDEDIRKSGGTRGYGVMLNGIQFAANGRDTLTDDADAWFPDNDGRVVNFNPDLNELAPAAHRDGGARLSKYAFESGSGSNMSNDFAVFRYAEILMNKAEALWRMDPGSSEALALVNQVRMRAGVAPYTSMTAEDLLAERGREFCFEIKRRTDLIRFDRWGEAWWEKPASEAFKKLMPIPTAQILQNPNLLQNPGYN